MTQITATQLLYQAAGMPDVGAEPATGLCYLCGGEMTTGKPAILPQTFMDYDRVRCPDASHICAACWFSMGEQSAELARLVGKDKPQRMRNYSHFVAGGRWVPLSKGDKRGMYATLLQGPELAVIAVSGQKHLVFKAQPGIWQVEEQRVQPDIAVLRALMAPVQALYEAGFAKGEIESGIYSTRRILQCGEDKWWDLEQQVSPMRGSALLELVVFLCQKSEEDDGQEETAIGVCGDRLGAVAGDERGLQAPVCAGNLGPVSEPPGRGSSDDEQPGPVRQLALL